MSTDIEDVGESPIRKGNDTTWQAGESANPSGRPKGKRSVKPRSKMRTTLSKLYDLQPDAIQIIKDSMKPKFDSEGKKIEVDKVILETAKYVVNKIESLNNSCLKEEMAIVGLKMKDNEAGDEIEKNQDDVPAPSNFSLDMIPPTLSH